MDVAMTSTSCHMHQAPFVFDAMNAAVTDDDVDCGSRAVHEGMPNLGFVATYKEKSSVGVRNCIHNGVKKPH